VEVGADVAANGLPEVGGEADEVKGELLADNEGGGGDYFLDSSLGDDGDVATHGGLLEGLEEGAKLAEVSLDLGEEDVHCADGFREFEIHSLKIEFKILFFQLTKIPFKILKF